MQLCFKLSKINVNTNRMNLISFTPWDELCWVWSHFFWNFVKTLRCFLIGIEKCPATWDHTPKLWRPSVPSKVTSSGPHCTPLMSHQKYAHPL